MHKVDGRPIFAVRSLDKTPLASIRRRNSRPRLLAVRLLLVWCVVVWGYVLITLVRCSHVG